MIASLSPVTAIRLEKLAMDNGFDKQLPRQGEWLAFASTRAPLRIWLSTIADEVYLAALSQSHVADALTDHGIAMTSPLPEGAAAGRTADDIPTLHRMMRRAFQLSRSLPNQLLHGFQTKTANLPRTTEEQRMVVRRIGQDDFRAGLLDYWDGRCAITGLRVQRLLRASHIKPWSKCATDAERLDIFNGLLLAPHLDAVFDSGYITVAEDGHVVVTEALSRLDREILSLNQPQRVTRLARQHDAYLQWHRKHEFERWTRGSSADAMH